MPFSRWDPSRREQRVADILAAIDRIGRYIGGLTRETFLGDDLRQDAVLRQLLIVAEACDKIEAIEQKANLPLENKLATRQPGVPWRNIRDMGIRIRHMYGSIDPELIWEVCAGDTSLAQLRTALLHEFPSLRL